MEYIRIFLFDKQAIAKDPALSRCKIIAEPWDCAGLYLVGSFPNWDRYALQKLICLMRHRSLAGLAGFLSISSFSAYYFLLMHDAFVLFRLDLVNMGMKSINLSVDYHLHNIFLFLFPL